MEAAEKARRERPDGARTCVSQNVRLSRLCDPPPAPHGAELCPPLVRLRHPPEETHFRVWPIPPDIM